MDLYLEQLKHTNSDVLGTQKLSFRVPKINLRNGFLTQIEQDIYSFSHIFGIPLMTFKVPSLKLGKTLV